jgi:alpha-beta hydrolase superfamily lysophospholipase
MMEPSGLLKLTVLGANMHVVDFAYQVIEMHERIRDLEFENNRLRQYEHDYHELLNESLAHNQAMMGNTLKLFLTPGVIEACQSNKTWS